MSEQASPRAAAGAEAAERRALARFRWVIGTPYFVQGTSSLTEVPILYFIKFVLGMGDAGGQLFDSLRSLGWFVKPLWGLVSDRIPLAGYRRKSWFVLMAVLAVAFWVLTAGLAALGVRTPWVFLLAFNLAFATYAFVDVVCDALMVEQGRRLGRVGAFVNFQWGVLSIANAGSVLAGGWFQTRIQAGAVEPWLVFLVTGIPPLATAYVGLRNIEEAPVAERPSARERAAAAAAWTARGAAGLGRALAGAPAAFRRFRRESRLIWFMVLFIFFWKFSPSVGFIERSYLIDVRGFDATSFGLILSAGGVTFFVSVLVYAWVVRRFRNVAWDHYLYAMVAIGVLSFPVSFFLYLEPDHPWWQAVYFTLPDWANPLPGWSRYEWFRLVAQTTLSFATIPAFMVPLTIAGETVKVQYAGVSYAFLMSLINVTNMFEGVVGAGLYEWLSRPSMDWLVGAFRGSTLDIAGTADERTLILQIFVYISLAFTLLTVPFIILLRRELCRQGVAIWLAGRAHGEAG